MNNNPNSIYKQTETGLLPEDWEVAELGRVAEIHDNRRVPLSEMERAMRKGSYPYCGANGIIDHIDGYIFEGEHVLLAEDGGDFGSFGNSAYLMNGRFWVNNHAHILRAIGSETTNLFLLYALNFQNLSPYIVGSTRKKLNQERMREIKLLMPPLSEQKKIAEVLSTVDEGIGKVDQAIEKTERLKRGLMQELLAKGIGHSRFKKTGIGEIPEDWEVVNLKTATDINRESVDAAKEFLGREFLYIDIDSIENEIGVIKSAKSIIGKDAPSRARRVIRKDDVLMSTVRPYLKAFAIVPAQYDGHICSTGFAVLTCKNELLPRFLLYAIFSKSVIDQCNKMMVGGQYPALNNSQVEQIKIPRPPLPEQQKIAEILSTVDKRSELLRKKKGKLERIKKGLMNDLLTGKKRVEVVA